MVKLGFLSLVIALAVGCFSVYQFEHYQKFVVDTQATLRQLETDIKPEMMQLRARLGEIKQDEHWKVAEATYLIRLAVAQWQVSHDRSTSIRLLAAADQALHSLQDPRFIPLRESLKQDQLALEAVELPDKEGLWVTITALINKVPDLPTRGIRRAAPTENAEVETAQRKDQKDGGQSWKAALQYNLQKFRDLIKIQRHSKPLEPILSENQQALAQETLRLLLEQMRWSVLHDNVAVYQTSIQQSTEWLNTYFETNDEQVKHLLTTLSELASVQLVPKLPEVGSALLLLQNAR